jgi:hypothetical protein
LVGILETLEVTTQTFWANLKNKILEWCGGAKADNKTAAEARWETLKIEDFISIANFDVYFYAAAKKCEASETANLHSECLRASRRAWRVPGYNLPTLLSSRKQ